MRISRQVFLVQYPRDDAGWLVIRLVLSDEPGQTNKEDGCTRHFWKSRYHSQALLTEEALLSSMAYVDLNPVRSAMASTSEDSDHTSVKERLTSRFNLAQAIKEQVELQALRRLDLPTKPRLAFDGAETTADQQGILFSLKDYLELVDHTGQMIRDDKRGAITNHLPPILQRLGMNHSAWLENATQFERNYRRQFGRRQRRLLDSA